MKIIKREDANVHKNTENSVSIEYDTKNKDINVAFVEINGRYPEKGKVKNKMCIELIYIIDGAGKLFIETELVKLKKDDVVLIEPNEKYYFEGNLKVIPACHSTWSLDQVELVDEE